MRVLRCEFGEERWLQNEYIYGIWRIYVTVPLKRYDLDGLWEIGGDSLCRRLGVEIPVQKYLIKYVKAGGAAEGALKGEAPQICGPSWVMLKQDCQCTTEWGDRERFGVDTWISFV